MNTYNEVQVVRLIARFKSIGKVAVDPTAVFVLVDSPDDAVVSYQYGVDAEIVKSDTGVYYIDIDTSGDPGTWSYRWYSTGEHQTSGGLRQFSVTIAAPAAP